MHKQMFLASVLPHLDGRVPLTPPNPARAPLRCSHDTGQSAREKRVWAGLGHLLHSPLGVLVQHTVRLLTGHRNLARQTPRRVAKIPKRRRRRVKLGEHRAICDKQNFFSEGGFFFSNKKSSNLSRADPFCPALEEEEEEEEDLFVFNDTIEGPRVGGLQIP